MEIWKNLQIPKDRLTLVYPPAEFDEWLTKCLEPGSFKQLIDFYREERANETCRISGLECEGWVHSPLYRMDLAEDVVEIMRINARKPATRHLCNAFARTPGFLVVVGGDLNICDVVVKDWKNPRHQLTFPAAENWPSMLWSWHFHVRWNNVRNGLWELYVWCLSKGKLS